MERKIGEKFQVGGKWVQCKADPIPEKCDCALSDKPYCEDMVCSEKQRSDRTSVIFVEVPCPDEAEELAKNIFMGVHGLPWDRCAIPQVYRELASAVAEKVRAKWADEQAAIYSERDALKAEVERQKGIVLARLDELIAARKERDEARAELARSKKLLGSKCDGCQANDELVKVRAELANVKRCEAQVEGKSVRVDRHELCPMYGQFKIAADQRDKAEAELARLKAPSDPEAKRRVWEKVTHDTDLKARDWVVYNGEVREICRITVDDGIMLDRCQWVCRTDLERGGPIKDPEAGGRALYESHPGSIYRRWQELDAKVKAWYCDLAARLEGGGK